MTKFPARYEKICKDFVLAFYNERKREIENNFLFSLPHPWTDTGEAYQAREEKPPFEVAFIYESPLANQIAEIARAAEGLIEDDPEGFNRGVVYEGIQDLVEQLFCPPGLYSSYPPPPKEFWQHPFGGMVGRALIWVKGDDLITQADAAKRRGVTIAAINNAIADGRLTAYHDPDAPNPRRGGWLVSQQEVDALP